MWWNSRHSISMRIMTRRHSQSINSLAPGKFEWHFRYLIFKRILVIDGWGTSCEITPIWMSLDFTVDQSTLVQVMAWCRQATSHNLSQCWPRSLSPYGVTRPQWVNVEGLFIWFCRSTAGAHLPNTLPISVYRFDGLVWDSNNSRALPMGALQSCSKPSIYASDIVSPNSCHYDVAPVVANSVQRFL